jgi:hypothetical protein
LESDEELWRETIKLSELIKKAEAQSFGKSNTITPQELLETLNHNQAFSDAATNPYEGLSTTVTLSEKIKSPNSDSYYFGGDSSRSTRLAGGDRASLTPEERQRIRERAERNTAMRLPSTRERREINLEASKIHNAPDSEVEKDLKNLANLIKTAVEGNLQVNGESVRLEVTPSDMWGPGIDRRTTFQSIVMRLISDDSKGSIKGSMLISRKFYIFFNSDGSIGIRKNGDAGDFGSIQEGGFWSKSTSQEMRIELSAALQNIEKSIFSALGAKKVTARYQTYAKPDGEGNVDMFGNGISFAAENDLDWAGELDKTDFLNVIDWIVRSGEGIPADIRSKIKKLSEKSRKEEFGKQNTVRPKDFVYGLDFDKLVADYSVKYNAGVSIYFVEKVDDPYFYGGDSSRSKRSSEIVEFNAPAPSKKQIKAISEIRNVVSDERKDYRLFSDEERNIPKEIFDGSLEINGEKYSSQIDTSNLFVSQSTNGSVEKTFKFSGKVLDKDGNEVASFSRGINFLDGKPVSVTHDGLYIKRVGQGMGVATALNARNEKLYKELGIPKVVVNASTSGDGKVRGITHWLRNGYSWDDSTSRNKVLKIIDKALQDSIIKDKEQESAVREIRESIRKNLSNFNDDINLESLANWDGADEWFSSMAKEEENQILNVKLSKNLNPSETSSRSKSTPNSPDGLSQNLKIQIDLVKQAMETVKSMGVTTTSYSHEDLNKNVIKKLNAEVLVIDRKIERVEKKFGDSEATLRGNEAVRLARLAIDTMARTPDEYQMRQGTDELLISRDSDGNLVGLAMTWTTVDEFARQEYMENEESSETRELKSRAMSIEYLVSFQTVKGMGRALFGEVIKKAAGKNILFTQLEPTKYSKEYWERVGFKDDTTSLKQDKLVLVTALDNLGSFLA